MMLDACNLLNCFLNLGAFLFLFCFPNEEEQAVSYLKNSLPTIPADSSPNPSLPLLHFKLNFPLGTEEHFLSC